MKICLSKVAEMAAYIIVAMAAMCLLMVMLFHTAVNYTYRSNPPTAEEIAEDPTLERFLK